MAKSVLITGAGGYIGKLTVEALAADRQGINTIIALDVRDVPEASRLPDVEYLTLDIRDPSLVDVVGKYKPDTVIHLASIVTPGKDSNRELEYSVDVGGTENILSASVKHRVKSFIVTSSGAAYGYYADNPEWIDEGDAIRGNEEFAYSHHKKLVENMLAEYRRDYPKMKQLILRPGAILGASTKNQITNLFDQKVVIGIAGSDSPFTFVWDLDVAACIVKGVHEQSEGIYNLAGDGALTMREIAAKLGKTYLPIPPGVVTAGLSILKPLGLSRYGPEQVNFLRYRPVLSNRRLKEELGFIPRMTSRQVFDYFLEERK